jgi:tryptophan synthase beta chain
LGTIVHPVKEGTQTLKDAINEAIRDWITNVKTTYYLLGSAVGPHPYPVMVRDFQSVIGNEILTQMKDIGKKSPDSVVACVGGGSNAIGTFYPLIDKNTEMFGIEAGGEGIKTRHHSATLAAGSIGILHGMMTYLLQDKEGQIIDTHSIAAGLDYPGVGPEHSYLKDTKRVTYDTVSDDDAVHAFVTLAKQEGIIPALESSHAVAYAIKIAKKMPKNETIVVTLSGRGDKDVEVVERYLKHHAKNTR